MPLDIAIHRTRAEAFLGALEKEVYQHFSGQKEVCDTSAVYDRFPDLFTKDAVIELDRVYDAASGDDVRRRLAYLLAFTVDGYVGGETRQLSDEIANAEGATTIEVDGERMNLRGAPVAQANEADRARRGRIQAARLEAVERVLNPLLDREWRRAHEVAEGLGYPHYMALYSEVKGIDYLALRARTDAFLHDTAGLYQRRMEDLVGERLGIPLEELTYADIPYLWRAPEFDQAFSAERLLPTLERTLAGLGIDLRRQRNVHLDTEARELKSPRAFCSPVRVPDEIYLCVMPQGGQDDYGALLHEAGHTEHFAHVPPGLSFEYRHLGDNAVTESYAFLLDHLPLNREWLVQYLDFAESDDFVRFSSVAELFYFRRYAAKLAYETELHTQAGSLDHMAEVYRGHLSEALMVPVPAENYLSDVDGGFYAASYLRAWMLEASWRVMLEERFGREWFVRREAGDWIKELWSYGQELPAETILLKYGGGMLNTDPLRHLLERVLGR
jgi:hypothetical protein